MPNSVDTDVLAAQCDTDARPLSERSTVQPVATIAYLESRREFVVVSANHSFLGQAELTADNFVGYSIDRLFSPATLEDVKAALKLCLNRGEPAKGKACVVCRDKAPVPVVFELSPWLQQVQHRPECLLTLWFGAQPVSGASAPVTTGEGPTSSRSRIRVGTWTLEPESEPSLQCSPEVPELLGLEPDDLQFNPALMMSRCHPDDRLRQERALKQAIESGRGGEFEHRVLLPNGEVRWLYVQVNPTIDVDSSGTVTAHVVDITDRVQAESARFDAESRFQAAANASLDFLFLVKSVRDPKGHIVDFEITNLNHRAESALSRIARDPKGSRLGEILPLFFTAGLLSEFVRVIRTGIPYESTVRNDCPELNLTWAHIQAVTLDDGLAITYRDISKEKRLEEELLRSRRLQSVGRIAASVAHDFNNMLSVILSLDTLVCDSLPDDSPAKSDLTDSLRATHRAGELTRRLLAFSRHQHLEPTEVHPGKLLRDLAPIIRVLAGSQTQIVTEIESDLRGIWVDASQLEQAIVNLVTNSRDAMPNGGTLGLKVATVVLGEVEQPDYDGLPAGAYCEICVVDSGIGIPNADKSRLFEPFFTTKPPNLGTGLGLASTFGFIKQSGGTILVSSIQGEGTTVRLLLPFEERAAGATTAAKRDPLDIASLKSEVVVFLEHDAGVGQTVRRILESNQITAHGAATVESAILLLEKLGSDVGLLMTDVVPPAPESLALLATALRHNSAIGIVYTSNQPLVSAADSPFVDLGAVRLLRPITPQSLLTKLCEARASSRQVANLRATRGRQPLPNEGLDESPDSRSIVLHDTALDP